MWAGQHAAVTIAIRLLRTAVNHYSASQLDALKLQAKLKEPSALCFMVDQRSFSDSAGLSCVILSSCVVMNVHGSTHRHIIYH